MPHLSDAEHGYEATIYSLQYDEIEDVSYKRYKNAVEYFKKELPPKIENKENVFNYAIGSQNYIYNIAAIEVYVLRVRAHEEYEITGKKGKAVREFCDLLSTLQHHP